MTIYVDPPFETPSQNEQAYNVGRRHGHQWSHLYTFPVTGEGLAELHKIAKAIGLKRAWFQQGIGSIPHYDVVPTKRRLAIAQGAIEATREESIKHFKAYRISIRPLSVVERFYTNAALLGEMVANLLPEAQHSPIEVSVPTSETVPILANQPIPLYWELGVKYQGSQYACTINAYELAIAVSEAKLEPFANNIVNEVVKRIYLVP